MRRLDLGLCLLGALLLLGSVALPWWRMKLLAPQYPEGLVLVARLDRIEGDIQEIDTLNHYIGVGRLETAAPLERRFGLPAVIVAAAGLGAAATVRGRRRALLAIPAAAVPIGFAIDLGYWMGRLSTDLDATAPMRVPPFSFSLWGTTRVAQFASETSFASGFWLAVVAAAAAVTAVALQRRAQPAGAGAP